MVQDFIEARNLVRKENNNIKRIITLRYEDLIRGNTNKESTNIFNFLDLEFESLLLKKRKVEI
jgi:hypothetical protein